MRVQHCGHFLYAYVGFAHEAGLPLQEYPNVIHWIERIRAVPGFLATSYPYSLDPYSSRELP